MDPGPRQQEPRDQGPRQAGPPSDDPRDDVVRRLLQDTPRPLATVGLIAANVLVWVATVADGLDPLAPYAQDLLDWGGNMLAFTLQQPWRLFTATLLHGGVIHLLFNMWVLWDTGRMAERFYGSAQFLLIYLLAALFASLASLFFAARDGVSVGASGAIFGVVGALLAALFTKDRRLPRGLVSSMRSSMLMFVGYSLFMGVVSSFIDNAAHLGGLVSGFLLALVLAAKFDREQYQRSAIPRAVAALSVSMVAAFAIWKLLPTPSA